MKIYAILLAGGKGLRFGTDIPKQFMLLHGQPVFSWALKAFEETGRIDRYIITAHNQWHEVIEETVTSLSLSHKTILTEGGKERSDSVRNALKAAPFEEDDILLFHDAARPLVSPESIQRCIHEVHHHKAAALYVPAVDTITRIEGGYVSAIPPRDELYYAQTPQGFTYGIISKAHKSGLTATDDVSLVITSGEKVKMVMGHYDNIKITNPEDLQLAEFYLLQQQKK